MGNIHRLCFNLLVVLILAQMWKTYRGVVTPLSFSCEAVLVRIIDGAVTPQLGHSFVGRVIIDFGNGLNSFIYFILINSI